MSCGKMKWSSMRWSWRRVRILSISIWRGVWIRLMRMRCEKCSNFITIGVLLSTLLPSCSIVGWLQTTALITWGRCFRTGSNICWKSWPPWRGKLPVVSSSKSNRKTVIPLIRQPIHQNPNLSPRSRKRIRLCWWSSKIRSRGENTHPVNSLISMRWSWARKSKRFLRLEWVTHSTRLIR